MTWQLRRRANAQYGTSEIWQAVAPSPLTAAKVTATRLTGSYQGSLTVVSFIGADTTSTGATNGASAATGAPSVSLTTTRPGAWVWGVGSDWDKAVARTVGANQTKVSEYLAPAGDTFWGAAADRADAERRHERDAERHRSHRRPLELRRR